MKAYREIVLSLGGSLIHPNGVDVKYLRLFRTWIQKSVRSGFRFIIVCGGGALARSNVAAARSITDVTADDADQIGIRSTEVNAEIVRSILRPLAGRHIITSNAGLRRCHDKVVVATGSAPGHSTDDDAVQYAIARNCSIVLNLTNVDGVYDADPRKVKNARRYDFLMWDDYLRIIGKRFSSGMHAPFDPVASRRASRHGTLVAVLDGKDFPNLSRAIRGEQYRGTLLHP